MPVEASGNDPWIGVHVLTEFIFCPRAGLIEFARSLDDSGEDSEDDAGPRLDYVPHAYYELSAIERDLQLHTQKLRKTMRACHVLVALLFLAVVISSVFVGPVALMGIVVAFGGYLPALLSSRHIAPLVRQRAAALRATPAEPDPTSTQNQDVNWWQLSKAGFESIAYKDPLRYEPWRLAGRPWRVLRRGSLRIPVFRKRHCDGPKGRVPRRQHYARIAAYCHLLERVEGAESPYGIILFGGTYEGTAIPKNCAGSWKPFREGLEQARESIRAAEQGRDPPQPVQGQPCKRCHHGHPYTRLSEQSADSRNGHELPIFSAVGVDRRSYHSVCGDRFRWIPPHIKAIAKRLQR